MSLRDLLRKVKNGRLSLGEAEARLRLDMVKAVEDYAKLDVHRPLRRRVPEVIFAENKTPAETAKIASELAGQVGAALVARLSEAHWRELKRLGRRGFKVERWERARMTVVRKRGVTPPPSSGGRVMVLTAGTADVPVAEEARVVAGEMGCEVYTAYDVGVAGFHRLLQPLKESLRRKVDVIVVVAGMEGALPSVVASLADCPVIGVPTSTGYGLGGGGQGALMSMLQSCTLGLAVVNIDNGVGAGALAALIANRAAEARASASGRKKWG
ncbi:nickel pincer cofactor biosynthesis protein LarB [Candidatus Hecatella orcuttiae]|jgi:hypothetical protein|uniref:nickel pincer cofactor biosynthesis protein LarB n=1 Tax=Candidatus Hecatella orcuttiae TaxID=1935119 RepID=UPI002867E4FC|nr:nickel pincer cofactor biosynthesis protein LarB [Candidatus Hecatella orcuttiae]